jgi:hypothetical protein
MRFASIGGQSNYAQAGKAVARDAEKTFDVARKNSVDFGGLARAAMQTRSDEKVAAMRAGAQVTKAAIGAKKDLKIQDTKIKSAKGNMMRKAGGLVALGVGGLGEKSEKRDYSFMESRIERDRAKANKLRNEAESMTLPETPKASTPDNSGGTGASNVSTTAASGGGGGKGVSGGGIGGSDMDYMNSLVNKGYKPIQAAAIVGNMRYESGDFKFSEELAPNAYGTKGYGALQWTNAGGSNRRDEFMNWSKNQGLDANSFEANAGFTAHEMVHGDSQGRSHWTGGGGLDGFKGQTDLGAATLHFAQNYLRPAEATANYGERQRRAQDTFTRWQQQQNT